MRDSSTAALVFGSILVLAAALATGCASGDSGTSSSTDSVSASAKLASTQWLRFFGKGVAIDRPLT